MPELKLSASSAFSSILPAEVSDLVNPNSVLRGQESKEQPWRGDGGGG